MKKPAKKPPQKTSNGAAALVPEWKPFLGMYSELSALTFPSGEEIDKGIDLLWTNELRTLPHDLAGGYAIIVPKEAVVYFANAGLKFKESRVCSISELSAEEAIKLRR